MTASCAYVGEVSRTEDETGKVYLHKNIAVNKRYLVLPVKNRATKHYLDIIVGAEVVRHFDIELAVEEEDFLIFLDMQEFDGKEAVIKLHNSADMPTKIMDKFKLSDRIPQADSIYKEALRPQVHFTSRRGWNNDSNGLVYYKGEYHLFYQHNPYGWGWGNMTWGHAVSRDMVHWEELPDAIHPDELGTIFSGSAVIDKNNTAGFKTGSEDVLVCIYTSAGGTNKWSKEVGSKFTQSIAYSNDRGRTFIKYDGNPVIEHINGGNRDPKVFWYEPGKKWVMALYLDDKEMAIFTSKDLKSWTEESCLPDSFHECPEMFELPIDGDENETKWIFYGGNGDYYIGDFNGKKFTPETGKIKFNYGNCFYASQTFNNMPDERRVQIAWGQCPTPGMPFNQMMLFPVELTLRDTEDGLRMFAWPIEEIESLYSKKFVIQNKDVKAGQNPLESIKDKYLDISAEIEVTNGEFGFNIYGKRVIYNTAENILKCSNREAKVKPVNGRFKLRLIVDRTSLEIFANDGEVYMPIKMLPNERDRSGIEFFAGDVVTVKNMTVNPLKSIW